MTYRLQLQYLGVLLFFLTLTSSQVIAQVLDKQDVIEPDSLELVIASDQAARRLAQTVIAGF